MTKSGWVVLGVLIVVILGLSAFIVMSQQNPTITKEVAVTLTIEAAPDFTLEVSPTGIVTPINRVVAYAATLTSVNNFAGDVTITVLGVPQGVLVDIFPSPVVTLGAGATHGVQITITVPDDVNIIGVHNLTVRAESSVYN